LLKQDNKNGLAKKLQVIAIIIAGSVHQESRQRGRGPEFGREGSKFCGTDMTK